MAEKMDSSFKLALNNDEESSGIIKPSSNLSDMFSEFMHEPTESADAATKPTVSPTSTSKSVVGPGLPLQTFHTLIVKVVHSFKFVNNENVAQGRIGMAVLQHDDETMRIILYRTKLDVRSSLTLRPTKGDAITPPSVHVKGDFLQYRDDAHEYWSVCFLTDADRAECMAAIGPKFCGIGCDCAQQANKVSQSAEQTADRLNCHKTELAIRMAKMGQLLAAMRPSVEATESSETDSKFPSPMPRIAANWKPTIAGRPAAYPASTLGNTMMAAEATSDQVSTELAAHFAELRLQNTEVRMNLSKLESRIDRVLDKMDTLPVVGGGGGSGDVVAAIEQRPVDDVESELIASEERMLAMRKENRVLRMRCEKFGVSSDASAPEHTDCAAVQAANATSQAAIADLQTEIREHVQIRADLQAQIESQELRMREITAEMNAVRSEMAGKDIQLKSMRNRQLEVRGSMITMEMNQVGLEDRVKLALAEFYKQFEESMSAASSNPSTEVVLKVARVLIKRQTQKVRATSINNNNQH